MASNLEEKQKLGLSDLALVMDNYQNILQMDTIILEQQKQVVELQKQLLKKQDETSVKQVKVCASLDKIIDKLDNYTNKVSAIESSLNNSCINIEDNLGEKIENLKLTQTSHRLEDIKSHDKITNKIYIGMVATSGTITALITLLFIVYDKYKLLENISKMLNKLLIYFNVG